MTPTSTTTIRFTPEERELLERLGDEFGLSLAEVVRRGLGILARQAKEEAERKLRADAKAAELLERLRAVGVSFGNQAVIIEPHVSERIAIRSGPHVFREIGGRLVVSRKREDGTVEIAYLDGPEPNEPDSVRFAEERVLT